MANLPEVDSAGTPLPKPKFLLDNCSAEDICKAMTLNSFSLAASASMANGCKVFYDPETKKAEIVHPNGQISEIKHS